MKYTFSKISNSEENKPWINFFYGEATAWEGQAVITFKISKQCRHISSRKENTWWKQEIQQCRFAVQGIS